MTLILNYFICRALRIFRQYIQGGETYIKVPFNGELN